MKRVHYIFTGIPKYTPPPPIIGDESSIYLIKYGDITPRSVTI